MKKSVELKIKEIVQYYHYIAYLLSKVEFCYPNPCYGTFMPKEKVLEAWKKTAARIREGKAPRKLCIYIHIPFCHCGCLYCMSGSIRIRKGGNFLQDYLRLIFREMEYFSPIVKDIEVASVYLGGGTPSILTSSQIEELITNLRKFYNVGDRSRIIFEASPFTLDEQKVALLKKLKVYELSLGIQSFDQDVLKKNRRPQKVRQSIDIIRFAQKTGIPSITVDIMVGMPYQSRESALLSIKQAIALGADGVMVNEFLPIEYIRFCVEGNEYTQKDHDEKKEAMLQVDRLLNDAGYRPTHSGYRKRWTAEDQERIYKTQESENLLGFGYGSYSHAFASLKYQLLSPFEIFVDRLGFQKYLCRDSAVICEMILTKLLDRRYEEFTGGRETQYFTYVGLESDIAGEMRTYAFSNIFHIDFLDFRQRFGKEFTAVFKTQMAILLFLNLVSVTERGLLFLQDDLVTNKVIRALFADKRYIQKMIQASEESYDPSKNYHPLILKLAREM